MCVCVWCALDHHEDSRDRKSGQYGDNELALSEISALCMFLFIYLLDLFLHIYLLIYLFIFHSISLSQDDTLGLHNYI